MVKFILGDRGSGKTKAMIDMANEAVKASNGSVVYIDKNKNHMYDLRRSLRFIDTGDFQMDNLKTFYGFLCGIISQDFDVEKIFIDGQKVIAMADDACLENFVDNLNKLSEKFGISFYVSCSRSVGSAPEFLKAYM